MAEPSRHERRQHFRGKPRPGRRLPIRWRAGSDWMSTETRNIGVGGAFIATGDPPEVGSEIAVELHLPTSELPFEVKAAVRWRRTGEVADGAGMGVEFLSIDIDVLLELNDYFASLTSEDAA